MRIAYLVNQYPKVSHAFIRREIRAVEAAGVEVVRWGIRRSSDPLVDPLDVEEAANCHVLLDAGYAGMLRAFLGVSFASPLRSLHALWQAVLLGLRSDRGVLRHLAYLTEACLLVGWAARAGVDHVHAHFGTNSATVAMLCHALGGPAFSFTVHGPEEFDKAPLLGLREKIARAAFVVAISSHGRSQLFRHTAREEWRKIKLVRCGVDEAFFTPPAPVPAAPRLVSIGRLCEQKGQLLLIEALAGLHAEGLAFDLVLVGDGELRPAVETAIARGNLAGRVRIVGWADSAAITKLIDDSRALVLPSFAEGLPVVIMEAFARARPVLSTFVAGIPELVVPGRNGWLVPAGSVEDLAACLRQVLAAPVEELTALGLRGREDVRRLHDITSIARELLAHFHAATGVASGAPGSASN
jgi:glycosyltransferase involved in cell wall biosynthesis